MVGTADYMLKKEKEKEILKEPDKNCRYCAGIGIDDQGRPCRCRY